MSAKAHLDGTRFVGRTASLARLRSLFTSGQHVVSVVGPSGMGKTRLASEFARSSAADFPGGVFFVSLADAIDKESIRRAMARDLGLGNALSGREEKDDAALASAIRDRGRCLIILDNADYVDTILGDVIARWASDAEDACTLITSTRRPAMTNQALVELGPLELDGDAETSEAVTLFFDRARAVCDVDALSPEEKSELRQLVRDLEGIPLALEISAARLGVLGAADLRKRMRSNGGGNPLREHAVARALNRSWELLDDEAKRLLATASIFRGGFTVDALEAVAAPSSPVLDTVQRLRDYSFFRHLPAPGAIRRLGLYEVVRVFALEKLAASGERPALLARYADYFGSLAAEAADALPGHIHDQYADIVFTEEGNLRAVVEYWVNGDTPNHGTQALSCAAVLATLYVGHGPCSSANSLSTMVLGRGGFLDETTEKLAPYSNETAFRVALAFARSSQALGNIAESERLLAIADHRAELLESTRARVLALITRSRSQFLQGREAIDFVEMAVTLATPLNDPLLMCLVELERHVILAGLGRPNEVLATLNPLLEAARASGSKFLEMRSELRAAHINTELGRHEEAMASLERGFALSIELNRGPWEASLHIMKGMALADLNSLTAAAASFEAGADVARRCGSSLMRAQALLWLALTALGRDDMFEARKQAQLSLAVEGGGGMMRPMAQGVLVVVDARQNDFTSAERDLSEMDATLAPIRSTESRQVFGRIVRAILRLAQAGASGNAAELAEAASVAEKCVRDTVETFDLRTRFLRRILARAVEVAAAPDQNFSVAEDMSSFRTPRGAADLTKKPTVRSFLAMLVENFLRDPGTYVDRDAIVAGVWPGERIAVSAAKNRVSVLASVLRQLGWKEAIESSPSGWRIAPTARLTVIRPANTRTS